MNPIGIMQGRLSPPVGGRLQSFPVDTWRREFFLAGQVGLHCIEWVYEAETETVNPLRTNEGVVEIRRLVEESGVAVWSVCADYYMTERLIAPDGTPCEETVEYLKWLVKQVTSVGARHIVLPFVDVSSLRSHQEIEGLLVVLNSLIPVVERTGVEIHLETDLQPVNLVVVLESINHPLIRANYDIGNSAALGRDPEEELVLLGPWLGSVHVKDRVLGGGTVPLGTGAADFPTCFRLFHHVGFRGPFILQTAREEGVSEIELAKRNRQFVEEQLAAVIKKGGRKEER